MKCVKSQCKMARFLSSFRSVYPVPVLFTLFLWCSTGESRRSYYARFIADVEDLERFEVHVTKALTEAVRSVNILSHPRLRQSISLYLMDFYGLTEFQRAEDVVKKYTTLAKHPICSFRLIRRIKLLLWDLIWQRSFRQHFGELWMEVFLYFWKRSWPIYEDLELMREKILRLQQVYDFSAERFANGLFPAIYTTCTLNSAHCYEIGITALNTGQYAAAIEWLELAKTKAWTDRESSIPFIEFGLWNTIEKHNLEFVEEVMLDLEPVFFDREISHVPGDSKNARKLRNILYDAFRGKGGSHNELLFLGVCAGENFQSKKLKARLFCWYEFKIHTSFIIGPRKIEFLHRDPDIVQIYEIISDKEIREFIEEATPGVVESHIKKENYELSANKAQTQRQYSSARRTSVSFRYDAWLRDRNVSKRIERATGLHLTRDPLAERLQAASYSFGGHNFPHMDQMSHNTQNHKDFRIATFMFYFNDVEKGGFTAFTSLGVAARPVKGSGLFWYNLYTDGGADWWTIHGACPVLFGSKWVANKWITMKDQFLVRKCGMKTGERFRIPVNGLVS